jgi:hypothetical protein
VEQRSSSLVAGWAYRSQCVVRVVPDNAEFWDTRGNSITIALKLVAARLSGNPPDLGENKKVQMG